MTKPIASIVWTKAHQREACARSHEIVCEMVRSRDICHAPEGGATMGHEGDFRWWLAHVVRFDASRIELEMRRVARLATGVWVRRRAWVVR